MNWINEGILLKINIYWFIDSYINVKDAYDSTDCLPLGKSHQDFSLPTIHPTCHCMEFKKKLSQEAEEDLWGCFVSTDWNALCEPSGDYINAKTECVTDNRRE